MENWLKDFRGWWIRANTPNDGWTLFHICGYKSINGYEEEVTHAVGIMQVHNQECVR